MTTRRKLCRKMKLVIFLATFFTFLIFTCTAPEKRGEKKRSLFSRFVIPRWGRKHGDDKQASKNGFDEAAYNNSWYKQTETGKFKAHLMIDVNSTKDNAGFTGNVWRFGGVDAQLIYYYGKLLEQPWKYNASNVKQLREQLYRWGFNSPEDILVTKTNTPLASSLKYYFNPRKLKHGKFQHFKDYFVESDFWRRLPLFSPFNTRRSKPLKKCAVIGNSGIILDSKCGKEIDSYDLVFRCNAAPIARFAEDAGWKANLTSFNPTIFDKRYDNLKTNESTAQFHKDIREYNGYLWFPCFGAPLLNPQCMQPFMSNDTKNASEPEFILGHPDHFSSLWKFWKDRNVTKTPSTGFYLTHASVQLCEETHLYGFWPFPMRMDARNKHLIPYHYFDHLLVSPSHGMNDEFSTLLQYHFEGVIRIQYGECTYPNGR